MMLSDFTFDEFVLFAKKMGLPAFRGEQFFDAVYSGKTLEEVSNLPKALKDIIEPYYPKYKITQKLVSKDGTQKFIVEFYDGNIVECVLMKYKYGFTACLSTQVGCRMGCKFCASSLNGLARNLSAGEILGQAILINKEIGGSRKERKLTNIVLMGSGEPLDNYDNVLKFIKLISSSRGFNISERNISLSTCGLVDKIEKLKEENLNITLSISLHATTDEKRAEIMPIANRYKIQGIIKACKDYYEVTGRKIYFEYTLIKGVNDRDEDVQNLARFLKGFLCHVNVIILNEVKERNLQGTSRLFAENFVEKLKKQGISATIRRTMGEDIEGACGQLRNKILKNNKKFNLKK